MKGSGAALPSEQLRRFTGQAPTPNFSSPNILTRMQLNAIELSAESRLNILA